MLAGMMGIPPTIAALFTVAKLGGGTQVDSASRPVCIFHRDKSSGVLLFSYVPPAFMAASAYVGGGGRFDMTILYVMVSWGVGSLLAWAIDNFFQSC